MKRTICLIFILFGAIQFSYAQITPLEIYSSNRFWKSDKTKTGSGFKFRNTTIVKHVYLFAIYKDQLSLTNKTCTIYKINKKDSHWSNATQYTVSDPNGQHFLIELNNDIIDNKHLYAITIIKTNKYGKELSVTRFDVKKLK